MGAHLITIARPTHHLVVAIAHKLYFEKMRPTLDEIDIF